MAKGTLTAEDIIKNIGGNLAATDGSAAIALASDDGTTASSSGSSSGTTYEEAAKIVKTLIEGLRAQDVADLEKLTEVPEDGISLPIVTDGRLKTLGTDVIMTEVSNQFQQQLDDLVVGQVPRITDEQIDEITKNDLKENI